MKASGNVRVPASTKIVYGLGQAAEGLKNTAFGLFLLFYYNQVLGLPGTLAGLALGISLVFDAFFDPLVGSISDNFRSKYGRRHPFMYAAILPMAVGFYLLFSPPVQGDWALFAWLFVFATLTRGGMALFHVPHIALGAELSDDFEERTSIVGVRQFLATFGGLLAIGIGFGVFFKSTARVPAGPVQRCSLLAVRAHARHSDVGRDARVHVGDALAGGAAAAIGPGRGG